MSVAKFLCILLYRDLTCVLCVCIRLENAHECKHKMSTLPRWLSSNRVDLLRKLLESDPAMLMRECVVLAVAVVAVVAVYAAVAALTLRRASRTMGVCADGSSKAFRRDDIESM